MNKLLAAAAVVSGLLASANAAIAADPVVESGHAYIHLDGTYAIGEAGSGIEDDFSSILVHPGDGAWVSGYAGYSMSSGWDWRVGAGFADLSAGDTNGVGASEDHGIDDAKMFNLVGNVGYVYEMNGATLRPFVGVQYLKWQQDHDLHPAVPLTCCFMNSDFSGVGPNFGLDVSMPVSDVFTLVGGADAALLFGEIDYTGGTFMVPSTGGAARTVLQLGAYAGFDVSLTENIALGARYRVMVLDGASYDLHPWDTTGIPTGKASNVLHGPTASLTISF